MPIFPPWKKSTLSTLRVCRTPGAQREARVAAVCGFPSRLRVCVRHNGKSPRCASVRAGSRATQKIPAAAGKILPFGRSQHRIWLVAGDPAPRQMLFAGRSPYPLLRHKVRCACNALRERAFHAPLPCSSVPNKTRFAGLLFGRGKRKIRRKICEKTSNSVFGSHHRI